MTSTDQRRPPILLVGPTASGKSALALRFAEASASDALIVNADALQVYDAWRVLTARPDDAARARAEHRLYGHVDVARADYSVGAWLRELAPILSEAHATRRRVIIVGGTGLNFSALTRGLAEIPATPTEIRIQADARLAALGLDAFADEIAARDPQTAARLDRRNPRRLTRAWEVLEATGKGLAAWAAEAAAAPLIAPVDAVRLALTPERDRLADRIDRRFAAMVQTGALEEVAAMEARAAREALANDLPGRKALGAAELAAYLRGEMRIDDAIDRAAAATRQYAKRQRTWLRNQLGDWPRLDPDVPEAVAAVLDAAS